MSTLGRTRTAAVRPAGSTAIGVALLVAVVVVAITQDARLLALVLPMALVLWGVAGVLGRVPATRQRTVLVAALAGGGVAMAVAWGAGDIALTGGQAAWLWKTGLGVGLPALLLLLVWFAALGRLATRPGAPGRAVPAVGLAALSFAMPLVSSGERCVAQGTGVACTLVDRPVPENLLVALAVGVAVWLVLWSAARRTLVTAQQ